jgi:23S rRNA U2552 (ribose-2'-O)-methylase RlmE/FtsJ
MEPSQYSEDLVESLRDMASIIDESQGAAVVAMLSGDMFSEAADEIERLYNEINDLRLQIVALSTPQQAYRG